MLVPNGFKPIAVMDDIRGNCVVSFNVETKEYFLAISAHGSNPKGVGPISLAEMEQLVKTAKDVIDQKGRYLFIDEYNADGTLNS